MRISIENSELLYSLKTKRKETMNDILTKLLIEYPSMKEELDFVRDAFEKQSKKIEEYVSIISDLKRKINERPHANEIKILSTQK